jgi:hypothetical protein
MLAVAFVVVSGLSVLGFYGYVLVQFYQESKRFKFRGRFASDGSDDSDLCPETATVPKTSARESIRRETLVHLGLAVSGLVGLFVEIKLINSLVTALHWY